MTFKAILDKWSIFHQVKLWATNWNWNFNHYEAFDVRPFFWCRYFCCKNFIFFRNYEIIYRFYESQLSFCRIEFNATTKIANASAWKKTSKQNLTYFNVVFNAYKDVQSMFVIHSKNILFLKQLLFFKALLKVKFSLKRNFWMWRRFDWTENWFVQSVIRNHEFYVC